MIASHKRAIKSGTQYNKYFTGKTEGKEIELLDQGTVYDTLKQMANIVSATLQQTKKIAAILKGKSVEDTCRNVWDFLYNHCQYKKDNPLREQLRTPLRSWKDRTTGIDCDCYSIFISSILTNLGIKHAFRMAGYKGGDYQHVYVVVNNGGKTFVIDPVVDSFNYEAPYTKKSDYPMTKVTMLNGVEADSCNAKPIYNRLRRYMQTSQVIELGYVPTQKFLEDNHIPYTQVIDDETDGGLFQVHTPNGDIDIKPIITKAESLQLLAAMGTQPVPLPQPPNTHAPGDTAAVKKFPWLWAAAAGIGVLILITGKDDIEINGLAGVTKHKTRRAPAKKVKKLYA